jgi:hydrogenase-4 component H
VGCLACEEVCPVNAIAHRDEVEAPDAARRIMIHYTDTCIFCGQCEAACINDHQGIRLTNEWELSFFDRAQAYETIEKELQLCEACGAPIACKDHLDWLALRLGELSFSSPTLFLLRLHRLGAAELPLNRATTEGSRADRVKILCARCRRKTTLTTA